jgi:hypothetical protein
MSTATQPLRYMMNASQGWVEIIANKGTFIAVPEQRTTTKSAFERIETFLILQKQQDFLSLFSFIINTRIFREV